MSSTAGKTRVNPSRVDAGDKVIYMGATKPPFFSDCTDPRNYLQQGTVYTIEKKHVFKWYTVFRFAERPGWFNSVDFKSLDDSLNV